VVAGDELAGAVLGERLQEDELVRVVDAA
jgi:hypothetical protein